MSLKRTTSKDKIRNDVATKWTGNTVETQIIIGATLIEQREPQNRSLVLEM
jgi:hypothetical protein